MIGLVVLELPLGAGRCCFVDENEGGLSAMADHLNKELKRLSGCFAKVLRSGSSSWRLEMFEIILSEERNK